MSWFDKAACAPKPPYSAPDPYPLSQFFDTDVTPGVCAVCVVRGQCLLADFHESAAYGSTYGYRGGMHEDERTKLFLEWDSLYDKPLKRRRQQNNAG